jgi:hypothetical protein
LEAAGGQAAGFPVTLQVTLTNNTQGSISWWCGGPEGYPPAEHFDVAVRYNAASEWQEVVPTNGQHTQGSGFTKSLEPGSSVVVPLAIPYQIPEPNAELDKKRGYVGTVAIRVTTKPWSAQTAQTSVDVWSRLEVVHNQRQQLIAAVVNGDSAFGMHLASQYPDPQVLKSVLDLATIDCGPIAARAARALMRQVELPESYGARLADAALQWLAIDPPISLSSIQHDMVAIALKTKSLAARNRILEGSRTITDSRRRGIVIDALRDSPGDLDWLNLARGEIAAISRESTADEELTNRAKNALKWLDSRIQNERFLGPKKQ